MTEPLRLAVVGCGAAAEIHLTVARDLPVEVTLLVDKRPERADRLADEYGVEATAEDAGAVPDRADAAVLSLPHHLHAPIAVDLLERGVDVLVEKPMALRTAECDRMIAAAESTGRVLAVGHARRFYDAGRFVKRLLDDGRLGRIERLDVREGHVYSWPVTSDFMFRPEAGGGVLPDAGAHLVDNLLWWMGEVSLVAYRDDARGGVAADCELELELADGGRAFVELSRTRQLRNTWILEGTAGRLEIGTGFDPRLRLAPTGAHGELAGHVRVAGERPEEALDCFARQLGDFVDSVSERRAPRVGGAEGRRFVALMESCFERREPLEYPWE